MASNVFKVRINCRIVATKTVEEIIMTFWLIKKITEIPIKPGLNGLKASYAPEKQQQQQQRKYDAAKVIIC